ncbi:Cytochrome p450 [Mycena sanguinolenta]|uniref:Cytochrome p450 n=1 Tax=Mycena sanguinolenta TaxID=230812 RepID=A0A8H6YH33_9AGAR|nr:Cytochrome p450 [Mycena sanguinolenta]
MPFSQLQTVALALGSCALHFIIRSYIRHKSLPPGPRGLPFIGNIFDVPKSQEWLAFVEMSRKYGSSESRDTIIVLNSLAAVDALLEDSVGFHWHLAFMRYGPRWKGKYRLIPSRRCLIIGTEHRKVFMQQFQPSQVLLHRPAELRAARFLLQQLLDSPAKYERHLRHMAGMIILSTVYGIDIQPEDDPYIDISERALHAMACTGNRGSFLVDSLPLSGTPFSGGKLNLPFFSLKYIPEFLPGVGFKRKAREWYKVVDAMPNVPYNFVKESRAAGTAKSSIASRVLDDMENSVNDHEEQELVLRNVLTGESHPIPPLPSFQDTILPISAGADTTVSALGTFFLAMTMYPDVQKKAQAAVDEVVGHGRLPDFQDDIPYIDAVVREVLRWRAVLPLSVPHAVTEDDIYKGYHIPAGAVVVGNTWAILNDETIYGQNTDEFIPERWLTKEGIINTAMRDSSAAFGFGRRICPYCEQGRDMAQWSMWITAASILATFTISKSVDEKGIPIEPSGEFTSGLLWYVVSHLWAVTDSSSPSRTAIPFPINVISCPDLKLREL